MTESWGSLDLVLSFQTHLTVGTTSLYGNDSGAQVVECLCDAGCRLQVFTSDHKPVFSSFLVEISCSTPSTPAEKLTMTVRQLKCEVSIRDWGSLLSYCFHVIYRQTGAIHADLWRDEWHVLWHNHVITSHCSWMQQLTSKWSFVSSLHQPMVRVSFIVIS